MAAGEGVEPSISAFKAQRVASYTIPQEAEADTEMGRRGDREKKQRLRVTASPFLRVRSFGALGFEPRTLRLSGANTAYKAAALPLSYAPAYESKVKSPMSKACFVRVDFGLWTLDFGQGLVAVAGVEPTSPDYRSSALPLSYTAGRGLGALFFVL